LIPADIWSQHSVQKQAATATVSIQPFGIQPSRCSAGRRGQLTARSAFQPPPTLTTTSTATTFGHVGWSTNLRVFGRQQWNDMPQTTAEAAYRFYTY